MTTRVVLLHGFTQGPGSWDRVAGCWDGRFDLVRPTLPGHGPGGAFAGTFEEAAAALADSVGGPPAVWVGYSMGGRFALRVALDHPELVRGLVLLGASPGLGEPHEREMRVQRDETLASGLERKGLEPFLEGWLRQKLFGRLSAEAAGMEERLTNTVEGLASVLRNFGPGVQEPLWDRLSELKVPTLLMAGEHDNTYSALAFRMAAAIGPVGELSFVPGASHAAHLERPEGVARLVARFVERLG